MTLQEISTELRDTGRALVDSTSARGSYTDKLGATLLELADALDAERERLDYCGPTAEQSRYMAGWGGEHGEP